MPGGTQGHFELETSKFGGVNTAVQFSQVPKEQSPKLRNGYMSRTGAIAKRPGTVPVLAALASPIKHMLPLTVARNDYIMAASGTTMYLYSTASPLWTAQTMTNPLNSSDFYGAGFTDALSTSVVFITDGGSLKQHAGSEVKTIAARVNDASPAPANILATTLNAKGMKYCWVYQSHVFVSDGTDTVWYSKRFYYDYFPEVQFQRFVQENDYVTGPGVAFNNALLIPMRKRWGVMTGTNFDDFRGNQFLNTTNGCIAPRSIQRITYPTGLQTIAYLSDDGVYEIYDTGYQETGSRQYSTRSLMTDKVDFTGLNIAEADMKNAVGYYDSRLWLYFIYFPGVKLTYVLDVRNGEWYPWDGIEINALMRYGNTLFYTGVNGVLRKFDPLLFSDWTDAAKTAGVPVAFERFSPLISAELTPGSTYWDEYILETKNYGGVTSTIDVEVAFSDITESAASLVTGSPTFVWGVSKWGIVAWATASAQYTEFVSEPSPLLFHKKARYVQVRWFNNKDEPVEIYREKWRGRLSGV